ncbi:hypothetical protein KDN34_00245 [Shewanella yunxiaonensis]|uniref:CopL family metal-binding regulatory protein n=1 Tax=Shewanella yunxiaonensis TaxID=2829809 RepID=A0ABX7YTX6_9GAMM|nr:hypothetical protein [Shewanella yunxiaonensis]QUN05963.1 hypothetical protein KDN34_00245 [Shewanella yunxiaonensis]
MQRLRRHMGLILTMLAFIGQGLLSNDHWMIPSANATEPTMMMSATSSQPMAASMDCHTQKTMTPDCCDGHHVAQVLPDTATHHCCDGKGLCKGGHCLVISVTGTLLAAVSWPTAKQPEVAVATPMPHFHSVDVNPSLKPPIA